MPFHDTQGVFFKEIEQNPFHVVFNVRDGVEGYIGESTAIEIVHALSFGKPIIKTREHVLFGERVPAQIKDIVVKNIANIVTLELDCMDSRDIRERLCALAEFANPYLLSDYEREILSDSINILNRKYEEAWRIYQKG